MFFSLLKSSDNYHLDFNYQAHSGLIFLLHLCESEVSRYIMCEYLI